ncbi:MAG: hypothetical protein ACFFE5_15780 [Candidatus Thorarchaeota archaeon]
MWKRPVLLSSRRMDEINAKKTSLYIIRAFPFVEQGQLKMCAGCGAKYLVCSSCGGLYCRIHPALESWELPDKCPKCGWVNETVRAWDGTSARHF